MKNVARIVLAMIIFLATGSALANAQNRVTNPCASVPTGADRQSVCGVQRKLDHTNRRVNKLEGHVKNLGKDVGANEEKIDGLAQAQTEDHTLLSATANETSSNTSKVSTLETELGELSGTVKSAIFIAVAMLLCGGGYLIWWLRNLKTDMEMLEGQLAATEIVIVNPHLEFLRSRWKSSVGQPLYERVIHFTERLTPDPKKGRTLGGDVSGYTATFEGDDDVDNQYPTIRYNDGPAMKLREVPSHAARILGLAQPQDSLTE